MRNKIIWTIISSLIVLSLVIASCDTAENGGTVTQQGTGQTVTTGGEEPTKPGTETEETPSDKPKYGGSITLAMSTDVNDFLPW